MAFENLGALKTVLTGYFHRTDLLSMIPSLIAIAEARMSRDLRIRAQETTITGTLSAQTITLPTDFIQMRRLYITANGGNLDLDYVAPDRINATASRPTSYTISGQLVQVTPPPDADYPYSLTYYGRIPPLVNDADSNYVLMTAPEAYVYAVMIEYSLYVIGDERMPNWQGKYQEVIADMNAADWGDMAVAAMKPDGMIR